MCVPVGGKGNLYKATVVPRLDVCLLGILESELALTCHMIYVTLGKLISQERAHILQGVTDLVA